MTDNKSMENGIQNVRLDHLESSFKKIEKWMEKIDSKIDKWPNKCEGNRTIIYEQLGKHENEITSMKIKSGIISTCSAFFIGAVQFLIGWLVFLKKSIG